MRNARLVLFAAAAFIAAACGGDAAPAPVSTGTPGKSIRDIALSSTSTPGSSSTPTAVATKAVSATATASAASEASESPTEPPATVLATEGEGPELPDFAISIYQGGDVVGGDNVSLYALLQQGRPVVINFWGSSCSGCLEEMPAFEKLNAEYGDRVLLVGVDVGEQVGLGTKEGAIELMKQLHVSYPTGATDTQNIVEDQRIFGLPRTVFLTPTALISGEWSGTLTEGKMRELYEQVLDDSASS